MQGGNLRPVTRLDSARGETAHTYPQFLPDGKHFLFLVRSGTTENNGIYVGSLDSNSKTKIVSADFNAVFVPGYLAFVRGDALVAQRFDWESGRLEGEGVPLASHVFTTPRTLGVAAAIFSISPAGLFVYRNGESQITPLVWFDRQGRRVDTVGEPGLYSNPALSPDGKRLAVARSDSASSKRDIWIIDLARHTSSRLTFDPADDTNATWSPDGSRIAFSSDRKGVRDLYAKLASGTGEDELLLQTGIQKTALDWSPDGRVLLFHSDRKLWTLPLSADRKPHELMNWPDQATFSPDGKWIAYKSSESGRSEVYVQPFPLNGGKWQISNAGGSEPYWRHDGKELYYMTAGSLMAVAIQTGPQGIEAGTPAKLFEAPVSGTIGRSRFVAAADGQRFLFVTASEHVSSLAIEVVINWPALLKH
jgi:Tol biopolymer transport system component